MTPDLLDRLLLEARPRDPDAGPLERAAVRVLARVAVLEGLAPPSGRTLRRRVAGALAAAALLLVVALAPASVGRPPGAGGDATAVPCAGHGAGEQAACWVSAALRGDLAARRHVKGLGAVGRDLLWRAAEAGQAEALRLLRGWGRLTGAGEVARAAVLVTQPSTAAEALDLLVTEPNAGGAEPLAGLLVERADLEVAVVGALRRLAARGERAEAVRALLTGAAAGRVHAAAAAVDLGPVSTVDQLLAWVPAARFEEPELAAALTRARPTVAARVLRRAEAGSDAALAWAAAAALDGAVPLLQAQALEGDVARAWHALDRLARVGGTAAWLAVARSTETRAGPRALERLATLPAAAVAALAELAVRSTRDRGAALWALACAGDPGLEALAGLGRRPALAPETLAALERSPSAGASERLRDLGLAGDSALAAIEALGRRLAAGHDDAGPVLVALSRRGPRRAALEALSVAGVPGERFFADAAGAPAGPPAPRTRGARAARTL